MKILTAILKELRTLSFHLRGTGHLSQQTTDDLEQVSVLGTHPVTEPDIATHGVGPRRLKRTLKPSVAVQLSKGSPHTSMLDCVWEEIHAVRKDGQTKRGALDRGDTINQYRDDDINIRDEPDLDNAPDVLCLSDDDPKDMADAMRWQDWLNGKRVWVRTHLTQRTSCLDPHTAYQVPPGKQIIPRSCPPVQNWTRMAIFTLPNPCLAKGFSQCRHRL